MEALATAEFDAGTKTRRSHHVAAVALRHFEGKDPLAIPSVARSDPFYIVLLGRVLRGPLANKILPSEARYAQEFLADHGSSIRERLIGGIPGGRSGRPERGNDARECLYLFQAKSLWFFEMLMVRRPGARAMGEKK